MRLIQLALIKHHMDQHMMEVGPNIQIGGKDAMFEVRASRAIKQPTKMDQEFKV